MRLDHGPQRQLLQVPELRLNEWLLVTNGQSPSTCLERLRRRGSAGSGLLVASAQDGAWSVQQDAAIVIEN